MMPALSALRTFAAQNSPRPGENGAAILQGMDSPSNVGALPMPSANDTMTLPDGSEGVIGGAAHANDVGLYNNQLDALRGTTSPAIRALMQQVQARNYGQAADLNNYASGEPAELATDAGDVHNIATEKAAEGQFEPFTSQLRDVQNAAKDRALQAQYITGPSIKAAGDQAVADTDAASREKAAAMAHPALSPIDGLRQAILKAYENGHPMTADDLKNVQAALANIK